MDVGHHRQEGAARARTLRAGKKITNLDTESDLEKYRDGYERIDWSGIRSGEEDVD